MFATMSTKYKETMMLGEVVRYPLRGEHAVVTLLIGGVLILVGGFMSSVGVLLSLLSPILSLFVFPFILLPSIFVLGYLVAAFRAVLQSDDDPPTFSEWTTLFVDGAKALAIGFVYALPLFVVITAVYLTFLFALRLLPLDGATVDVMRILLNVMLDGLILLSSLVYGYVTPVAIAYLARSGRVSDAFQLRSIGSIALSREYAVAWLIALAVAVGGGMFAGLLSIVLIGAFITFYLSVVLCYCYATGVANAFSADSVDSKTTPINTPPHDGETQAEGSVSSANPPGTTAPTDDHRWADWEWDDE
jgi:hypothetical protein